MYIQWKLRSDPVFLNISLKSLERRLPKPGDTVYFREPKKLLKEIKGINPKRAVPAFVHRRGSGGVFARAIVAEEPTARRASDAYVDHGDEQDWKYIIRCKRHEYCHDISFDDLRRILRRNDNFRSNMPESINAVDSVHLSVEFENRRVK